MQSDQVLSELADGLWQAEQTSVPAEPLTKHHRDLEIGDAHAIQSACHPPTVSRQPLAE